MVLLIKQKQGVPIARLVLLGTVLDLRCDHFESKSSTDLKQYSSALDLNRHNSKDLRHIAIHQFVAD